MIRAFEIFCKLNLIKLSAMEMFEEAMLVFSKKNCPVWFIPARHVVPNIPVGPFTPAMIVI